MSTKVSPFIEGIVPAVVTPFTDDLAIDEEALRRHVSSLAAMPGVTAILCNGHTGEISSLLPEERAQVVQITRQVVGPEFPILAGVHGQSTREALAGIRDAARAGATAALVFSPFSFSRGAFSYPEVVLTFYETLAKEGDLPIYFMQYPASSGLRMPQDLLIQVSQIDGVIGVKEAVGDIVAFEEEYRAIVSQPRRIAFLSAYEGALFATFAIGCDGATVGLANFAEPVVELWRSVQQNDFARARAVNDLLFALSNAIYKVPSFRWTTRLKYALWRAGRIPSPAVRPPMQPVTERERAAVDHGLELVGLLAGRPA